MTSLRETPKPSRTPRIPKRFAKLSPEQDRVLANIALGERMPDRFCKASVRSLLAKRFIITAVNGYRVPRPILSAWIQWCAVAYPDADLSSARNQL